MSQSTRVSPSVAGPVIAWLSIGLAAVSLLWWASTFLFESIRMTGSNGQLLIVTLDTSQKWLDAYAETEGVRKLAARMQGSGGVTDYQALGFGYWAGSAKSYGRFRIIAVPLWFLTLLLALPAGRYLWVRRRQSQRAMRNQCLHCGYDIRSSAGRCPECGTPIPAASPSGEPPARAA